jgi:DNA-binding transcriptional ArsR family regulator
MIIGGNMAESRLFQALSDPTRLKIMGLLAAAPLNVTGIVVRVKAAQPAVSRHLRILREVGLIEGRRLGKEVEYSLRTGPVREASAWLASLASGGEMGGAGALEERASAEPPGPPATPSREGFAGSQSVRRRERISPLEARRRLGLDRGVAPATPAQEEEGAKPQEVPHQASERPAPESKAARRKAPRPKARKPRPARRRKAKGVAPEPGPEAEAETAFVVDRDEGAIDDFLL